MVQVTMSFQPGDSVQEATPPAPPIMTVISVGITGAVECEWYVAGVRQTAWFGSNTVHLVTPKAP